MKFATNHRLFAYRHYAADEVQMADGSIWREHHQPGGKWCSYADLSNGPLRWAAGGRVVERIPG